MMLLNPSQFTIPKQAPGRLTGWDIILFIWSASIDPSHYTVVVESLDTAGATFRSIGKLAATLELPSVNLDLTPKSVLFRIRKISQHSTGG